MERLSLRELVGRTNLEQVQENISHELDYYHKLVKGGKNSMRASDSFNTFFNRIKQQGSNSNRDSNKVSRSFALESLAELDESFHAIIEDQQSDDKEKELQLFIMS